jgi:hypothetical protein
MYKIFLFPTNTNFWPHVWKEGGEFTTFEAAEFQAEQIRTGMQKDYKKVLVIPAKLKTETFSSDNKQWFLIVRRTFEAANFPKGSAQRAKLNESNMTSEYMTSYKWAIIGENLSSSARTLSEAKEKIKGFLK